MCHRCDATNFKSRPFCEVCGKSRRHWGKKKNEKNENEAEQGWTEAVRPKWKANAVATSCCMEVENTEEKVQQYVADVNTGNSKPEVSGWQKKWKWEEMKKEWK